MGGAGGTLVCVPCFESVLFLLNVVKIWPTKPDSWPFRIILGPFPSSAHEITRFCFVDVCLALFYIVFIYETKESINESDIIYIKSLANKNEYSSKNKVQLGAQYEMWVDAGRELLSMGNATVAYWDALSGSMVTIGRRPYVKRSNCGARAVMRIKLVF